MRTSYHAHTLWSDGSASVAEMLAAARDEGLDELGISDHLVVAPGEMPGWGMSPDQLPAYVAEVRAAAAGTRCPVLRLGVEADFFPETIADLRRVLASHPFEYVIGSVHFLGPFPIDRAREDWQALAVPQRRAAWAAYWERIRQLAASGVADIVGHLDLPKRFGFFMDEDLLPLTRTALDEIARAGLAIELNTAGWHMPAAEAYPAPGLLRDACRRGIPVVVTADAHQPDHVARDLARGRELARACGYRGTVRFERRRRIAVGW